MQACHWKSVVPGSSLCMHDDESVQASKCQSKPIFQECPEDGKRGLHRHVVLKYAWIWIDTM